MELKAFLTQFGSLGDELLTHVNSPFLLEEGRLKGEAEDQERPPEERQAFYLLQESDEALLVSDRFSRSMALTLSTAVGRVGLVDWGARCAQGCRAAGGAAVGAWAGSREARGQRDRHGGGRDGAGGNLRAPRRPRRRARCRRRARHHGADEAARLAPTRKCPIRLSAPLPSSGKPGGPTPPAAKAVLPPRARLAYDNGQLRPPGVLEADSGTGRRRTRDIASDEPLG